MTRRLSLQVVVVLVAAAALAGCAPSAGDRRPAAPEVAILSGSREEVVAAIAEAAVYVRPDPYLDKKFEYFVVTELGDATIKVMSVLEPVSQGYEFTVQLVLAILAARSGERHNVDFEDPIEIEFSTLEWSGRTVVAYRITSADSSYVREIAAEAATTILAEVRRRFG